jgi:hypothetical protein
MPSVTDACKWTCRDGKTITYADKFVFVITQNLSAAGGPSQPYLVARDAPVGTQEFRTREIANAKARELAASFPRPQAPVPVRGRRGIFLVLLDGQHSQFRFAFCDK